MQESLVSLEAMGVEIGHTSLLMMLAESYWVTGQTTAGWDTLAAARDIITKNTEHYYEAEFLRLSGELLLQESQEKQSADVERYFQQACRLAHHQHAKAFELRAAMSLCRLWQSQGRHAAARDVLADVYSRFTEGFDTADLKQAKALIDGL
jgi:predicted ATPase